MAGYTRQSAASIINGENITAPPLNAEFNAIATAFADATGHAHDGTTGQGPKIDLTTSITGYLPAAHGGNAGKNNYAATSNPGVGDDINDGYNVGSVWYNVPDDRYWVCMYSAAGAAVWLENRFVDTNNDIAPHATNTVDLGATLKRFKDLFLSGNADIDGTINVASTAYFGGTLSVQGNTTLNGDVTLGNSATDDINVTARFADDLIPSADDSRDLGSSTLQWRDLHLDGTANIDILDVHENATVAGNTTLTGTLGVTGDTTVANLTSTGTSTHATVDINGGSIDGVDIGSNSVGTGAFSTITASGNITGNLVGNVTGNVSGVITGNVTGNVTSSGTSSFTTIAVSGGTVNGAVIGGSSPAAITGTTITSNNGFTGDLTGDVTGNLTGNVTGNVTATTGDTTLNNLTVNGTVDVTSANIVNVLDPTSAQHAATKNYVDVQVSNLVASAPGTLDTLNELAAALGDDPNFSTTVTNSIATKLPLAGGTMTGNLNMGSQNITNLNTPVNASDAVTKGYIDTVFGSTSSAATSATNAANSATAAASSATDAANSYDSFDDRYLGAKNDLDTRTTDNDGDALVTGALAFDSVNNVMKVWDGSEFVAASSSIDGIKNSFRYTATAGQTVFSGSDANSQTLVIDQAGLVNVFLNGVRLIQGSGQDYTVSAANNNITLLSAAAVNDVVEIEVFGNFAGTAATSVNIGGGSVTGLTSLGVSGGNATFGDNDKIQLGDDSDVQLYHDGLNNQVVINSGHLYVTQNEADKDIIFYSDDGSGGTAAYLNIDGSEGAVKLRHYGDLKLKTIASGIDVTGSINITGSGNNPNIRIDDNDTSNNGEITLDNTALRIEVDEDAAVANSIIKFRVDGSTKAVIDDSGYFGLGTDNPSQFMHGRSSGNINFLFETTGDSTAQIQFKNASNQWATGIDNAEQYFVYDSTNAHSALTFIPLNSTVFNQNSKDVDFRIESDSLDHALFIDGGTGQVAFGTTGIKTKAVFSGSSGTGSNLGNADSLINQQNKGFITVENTDDTAGVEAGIIFRAKSTFAGAWAIYSKQNGSYTGDLIFRGRTSAGTASAERMRLKANGRLGINEDSPSSTIHLAQPTDNSAGGLQIRNSSDTSSIFIYQEGNNTIYDSGSAGSQIFRTNSQTRFQINNSGSVVFNEDSNNQDFRIESDGSTHAVFLDASTGNVGFNSTDPKGIVHVTNSGFKPNFLSSSAGNSDLDYAVDHDEVMQLGGFNKSTGVVDAIRVSLETNGDVTIEDGNLVVASGHGINFSATSGSGTSEILNDYEEGNFTVTLNDAAGNSANATFRYVKVGRCVNISGVGGGNTYWILNASNGGGAGSDLTITGSLPFTPKDNGGIVSSAFRNIRASDGTSFIGNGIMPVLGWRDGSSEMYLDHTKNENSYDFTESCERDSTRTNIVLQIQGWYYTDS